MKAAVLIIILAIPAALAQAQQRDSLLIEGTIVPFGQTSAIVHVWAVTYDSIYSYNMGFKWYDIAEAITGAETPEYFPPLSAWDILKDSVNNEQDWINVTGVSSLDSLLDRSLFTNGIRMNIFNLRLLIAPSPYQQEVPIDTISIGTFSFGYRPVIVRLSSIHIGPQPAVDEDVSIPIIAALNQNYPNPFNAQTTISYNLPVEADVNIGIYDILGHQTAILTKEHQSAGPHQVCWDAKDSPSGIYFYRLQAGERVETRRMLLIR